jgi:hypothetical protein
MDPTFPTTPRHSGWSWRRVENDPVRYVPPATVPPTSILQRPVDPYDSLPLPSGPLPAAAIAGVPNRDARDAQVRRQLDAFYMSLTGWYYTPAGKEPGNHLGPGVAVGTPFMMNPGYPSQQQFLANPKKHAAMERIAARAGLSSAALARVQAARGTPEEIHRLTQALIDAQPPGTVFTSLSVRQLMFDHAIGIDCAGYVQQAYLLARGRTAVEAGFTSILNERLSGLAYRGYQRIEAVADLRPGDLIVLNHPPSEPHDPGHRAIVYDQRVATAADLRTLLASRRGQAFALGGPVRVLEMDSSYGSWGIPAKGGVQRQTWLYNESTGRWAREILEDKKPTLILKHNLYGHPLEGFYRRKGD